MKISMMLDYSGDPRRTVATARNLEQAGLDIAWVAELALVEKLKGWLG